jgi:hypothetical protein
MKNKAFSITEKRGIVRPGQFCNGPLQNCILNTHLSCKTFRVQGMKRIWALV